MEFFDEDARPRFILQSRSQPSPSSVPDNIDNEKPSKLFLSVSLSISTVLLALSIVFLEMEPLKSILIWIFLSLFLGPLAPSTLTGGHTRVGYGPIVEFHPGNQEIEPETKKKHHKTRSLAYNSNNNSKTQEFNTSPVPATDNSNRTRDSAPKEKKETEAVEEKEWTEEDIEMLKKQMVKNPVGKPKRWEVIAEAFNGRHKTESVIKKAKGLGQKKIDDGDSYERFLKNRKSSDARVTGSNEESTAAAEARNSGENVKENGSNDGWSGGDDIALLNALKAFPKDAPMRWEKIAAAVPGKTKAACMKRVGELKRGFRNSKAGNES